MKNPLSKKSKKKYAGSIVLGLNDAIVEITGALFGLTFALQNPKLIAATGLIVGIAASLSMAASEYLHEKETLNNKTKPLKSAMYTGFAYLITVLLLVSPYLILKNPITSAITMLFISILIIAIYSYYISNQNKTSFSSRFFQMTFISLGVAAISFVIGNVIKSYFGI
jgi:vacuolar iron transporter family protein